MATTSLRWSTFMPDGSTCPKTSGPGIRWRRSCGAWQMRPVEVEPFRPRHRAALPDLHRPRREDLPDLPMLPATARKPAWLPGMEPTVGGCPSWLLALFDQAGGRSMRPGRGAPWDLRLFVAALLSLLGGVPRRPAARPDVQGRRGRGVAASARMGSGEPAPGLAGVSAGARDARGAPRPDGGIRVLARRRDDGDPGRGPGGVRRCAARVAGRPGAGDVHGPSAGERGAGRADRLAASGGLWGGLGAPVSRIPRGFRGPASHGSARGAGSEADRRPGAEARRPAAPTKGRRHRPPVGTRRRDGPASGRGHGAGLDGRGRGPIHRGSTRPTGRVERGRAGC